MKPRIEKTTKPAKRLVPQLISVTITASLHRPTDMQIYIDTRMDCAVEVNRATVDQCSYYCIPAQTDRHTDKPVGDKVRSLV